MRFMYRSFGASMMMINLTDIEIYMSFSNVIANIIEKNYNHPVLSISTFTYEI